MCRETDVSSLCLSLRYECPAGCLDSKAKVIGSVHYEMVSRSGNYLGIQSFHMASVFKDEHTAYIKCRFFFSEMLSMLKSYTEYFAPSVRA